MTWTSFSVSRIALPCWSAVRSLPRARRRTSARARLCARSTWARPVMADALALRSVSAGYGETVVLEDINLTLAPGENVSIIGRNGVGKTTLLATILGATRLHGGEVVLDGNTINRMPVYARALAGIGFVPQEREIFPSLTVRENLEI